MNSALPKLSKWLSNWASFGYNARIASSTASNDAEFDLRQVPPMPASATGQAARLSAKQPVLLNGPSGEPRYIDGSMLVRRRDS